MEGVCVRYEVINLNIWCSHNLNSKELEINRNKKRSEEEGEQCSGENSIEQHLENNKTSNWEITMSLVILQIAWIESNGRARKSLL